HRLDGVRGAQFEDFRRLESAITVAQEEVDYSSRGSHREVLVAVAVEIAHHQRLGAGNREGGPGAEGAVAVTQQDLDVVDAGDRQVRLAVAGEAPRNHGGGQEHVDGRRRGGGEGASAGVEQVRHDVVAGIAGESQVELVVPVEVPRRQGGGRDAGCLDAR